MHIHTVQRFQNRLRTTHLLNLHTDHAAYISIMTMLWLSMYTLISVVNTFKYFALCMMCPCDALPGVALSVQDEGLHNTGIPSGVCVLWTPLVT